MTKRVDEWIASSKKLNKSIFFYQDKVLDLSNFMEIHPGGKKALTNYLNKDITNIIFTIYPHKRETTLSTLMKYVIGRIPEEDMRQQPKITRPSTMTSIKEKKKVNFENEGSFKQSEKVENMNNRIMSKLKSGQPQKQSIAKQISKQKIKKENKQKSKPKEKSIKKSKESTSKQQKLVDKSSCKFISSDLDQQKPFFKVPILHTKNIFLQ